MPQSRAVCLPLASLESTSKTRSTFGARALRSLPRQSNELDCAMPAEFIRRDIKTEDAIAVVGYKSSAYQNYLSARLLYNNGIVENATVLACQSVEKLIKSIMFVFDVPIPNSHEVGGLWKKLKSRMNEKGQRTLPQEHFIEKIDPEYLALLSKVYRTRYAEDLPVGFNYVLFSNKLLAELDYTYAILDDEVRISAPFPEEKLNSTAEIVSTTGYTEGKKLHDEILWKNNHVLHGVAKAEFLKKPETIVEMRLLKRKRMAYMTYRTRVGLQDSGFLFEGYRPADIEGNGLRLAFGPDGQRFH